ncbi:MAG: protein translocase subunit SecF [Hyphomicrobiales bacterium]|nr:protein translocase subunit SecF [Hyphomicrobiales bacterium]
MRHIRLIPDDTNIKFMWLRRYTFTLSAALAVGSILLFLALGLNLGIDFRGGTLIEVKTVDGPADIGAIRSRLGDLNLGDVEVQTFGAPDEVLIRVESQESGEEAEQAVVDRVKQSFGDEVEYRRVEVVGPRVSSELAQAGVIGVLAALFAITIYIWFRFEWHFSVGAIIATVHDVIITIGMFSLVQLEFNLSSIAAILTIVGYSLNDTVVVYDRVRENLRRYKKLDLPGLLDVSINQMLSRTVLTSLTTLIALFALYIFGGEVIRSFVFAMIFGIFIGTYSSIFIAAPVLIFLNLRSGKGRDSTETSGGEAKPA